MALRIQGASQTLSSRYERFELLPSIKIKSFRIYNFYIEKAATETCSIELIKNMDRSRGRFFSGFLLHLNKFGKKGGAMFKKSDKF